MTAEAQTAGPDRQVPAYTATDFSGRRHRHCVMVFVINENGRLLRQLDKMQAVAAPLDVVIADGGSTDGSTTAANLAPRGVRTLLVKTGPGKLSAQMRMAFDWALRQRLGGTNLNGFVLADCVLPRLDDAVAIELARLAQQAARLEPVDALGRR